MAHIFFVIVFTLIIPSRVNTFIDATTIGHIHAMSVPQPSRRRRAARARTGIIMNLMLYFYDPRMGCIYLDD